jgi:hypothetical protein
MADYLEIARQVLKKYRTAKTVTGKEIQHHFPHCPRCTSYFLYRKNNQGDYQCETCGLEGITEAQARRVQ